MQFFAGVRLPVAAFPIWGKVLAFVFPLTFVLDIFRGLVVEGKSLIQLWEPLLIVTCILIVLTCLTTWLLHKAEAHSKETGNMTLF